MKRETPVFLKLSDEPRKRRYRGEIILQKGDVYETYCEKGLSIYEVTYREYNEQLDEWTIYLTKTK